MKTRWVYLCLIVFILALGLPASRSLAGSSAPAGPSIPGADQTRLFQQGLNGYSGVTDTWVSNQGWDTPPQHTVNYGRNEGLLLSRNGGDDPLLRFDLTSVPTNSAVLSATLMLYNITPANCTQSGSKPRRMKLHRMLSAWDEGNQVQSPIDAPGDHGATGDFAFHYYPGEGTDVAWSAPGLAAGVDYAATSQGYTDVLNQGWYTWNVTSLVRAWVRGEVPNDGLVLLDDTGYQDGNCDWRSFVSSQSSSTARRPTLAVSYNPDVPYANAGADQKNWQWDGSPLTLDGSASHDHPGGDDASLVYAWKIVTPAYGSSLAGLVGSGAVVAFTPDARGEWEIELAVTNTQGYSASDRVHLSLLSIPAGHPRVYLTPTKLAALQARAMESNFRWTQLRQEADDPDSDMQAKALVSQVTEQAGYCDQAVAAALQVIAAPQYYATEGGDVAVVYDWCYARLSAAQKTTFNNYFDAWANDSHGNDYPGWGNYWPSYSYSYAVMGLAAYGDNPHAPDWLEIFRFNRYGDIDIPLLDRIADGGGWPEGMIYDWLANRPRMKSLEAWRTAAGEDLFESSAWYRNRLAYILLHRWPGQASQWGSIYHPYLSIGDTERNRGSMANYERIMALILLERFPTAPFSAQLQAYLAAPPANNSQSFLYHEEFLWFNPAQASTPPALLTHYASALGTIFMRSAWPGGAADTNTTATYLTFQSGDHYTYHQHYDQNSFTLFKYTDLALDSGVYSGNGLSYHDINYYVRTIAHNTLVVYNPSEDFSASRPDATSNDGGQRSMYPASRSPQTVEDFDQHARQYETGQVGRYEDSSLYTYALGDATAAYNNPTYNQAQDAGLAGNTAKVSRFQREFVYVRPPLSRPGGADYVVILDRVGVTQAAFSGANTKLLFHVFEQPVVNGTASQVSDGEMLYTGSDLATVTNGQGKLFIKTLLPAAHNLRRVGGRGQKAFWVFGANYDWHWDPSEPQPRPVSDFDDVPYGEWRLELEPADNALEHVFLNVLYPTSSTVMAMPTTTLIAAGQLSGAHIADAQLGRVVLFSAAQDGSSPQGSLAYTYTPITDTLNMLFDLAPGARYQLSTAQDGGVVSVTLAPAPGGEYQVSSQGVLSFTIKFNGTPQTRRWLYLPLTRR